MKGMPIRNCYYVLAQQLRGDIVRAPNTTKKFNDFLTKDVEDVPPSPDDKTPDDRGWQCGFLLSERFAT
jgi:hypothetical protein